MIVDCESSKGSEKAALPSLERLVSERIGRQQSVRSFSHENVLVFGLTAVMSTHLNNDAALNLPFYLDFKSDTGMDAKIIQSVLVT